MGLRDVGRLLKETFDEFGRDNASLLAAGIAFYALISLAPMLLLVVVLLGVVLGPDAAQGQLAMELEGYVGEEVARTVSGIVDRAWRDRTGVLASILGGLVVLWGGTRLFMQVQTALNQIWNVRARPGNVAASIRDFAVKRVLSFGLIVVLGVLVLASMLASTTLSAVERWLVSHGAVVPGVTWTLADAGISAVLFTGIFGLVYRYLPDTRIAWQDVWLGAAVTALLFVLGKYGISVYLSRAAVGSTYGAAGSLVVLLVWMYYSALIFFLGAEFTQVWARSHGSGLEPEPGAVRSERFQK